MKKVTESAPRSPADDDIPDDDLRPYHEFRGGVRGKYAARMQPGMTVVVNGERFVIQPDRSLAPYVEK